MASVPPVAAATVLPPAGKSPAAALLADPLWRAPLMPVALAFTAGVILDRYLSVPLLVCLVGGVGCLIGWLVAFLCGVRGLALVYLGLAIAALAAGYHQWHREVYPAEDVGNLATAEPQPAHLRGVVEEEPVLHPPSPETDLYSFSQGWVTAMVLQVTGARRDNDWLPASGRVRLTVRGPLKAVHVGDEVDVIGWLSAPRRPGNPGEFDFAAHLRDQRIRAVMTVYHDTGTVVRLEEGWPRSVRGWLAVLRGRCRGVLDETMPGQSGLAAALLLGDGEALSSERWDKYVRTGVVQVLVVSGQHLVVLGGFLWFVLRCFGMRARYGAVVVAAVLWAYAVMVGGEPPVIRSAVIALAICGGLFLRRPPIAVNTLALSWIVVGLLNPTDLFTSGCQLSFLCVTLLYCTARPRQPVEQDPVDQLVEKNRPLWQRWSLAAARGVGKMYALTLAMWLAMAPLVAARHNIVSPVGLLITPPLVLLTSLALVTGFLLLLTAPLGPPAWLFAQVTRGCLIGSDWLVDLADRLPGGCWYLGGVPSWWLWQFYLALLGVLMLEALRRRWRWFALAGVAWLCVGLTGGAMRRTSDELRCTFLDVGHGGCTVIETPDGRTLLYDAGAMAGSDVTRRQIAPYLWHRGIRHIDEVFLSHADMDHFNGLPALLDRFAVGQVTCTPTFSDKPTPAVQRTLEELKRRRIPIRTVKAGDYLTAGSVTIEVLHPPEYGVEGNENANSLVLLLRHANHKLLLTGDLEGAGQRLVLDRPPTPVHILMAPHHGSRVANTAELADWARPGIVISCQGAPRSPAGMREPYSAKGARFLTTWEHGAVTVRSSETSLVVETFRRGERFAVRAEREP